MEVNSCGLDHSFVENVSIAVVREYLHGKGYQKTLQCIDSEIIKTDDSITSRTMLANALHIEKLLKKNKQNENALKTMLEVLIKYFLTHVKNKKISTPAQTAPTNKSKCKYAPQKNIQDDCTGRISSPEPQIYGQQHTASLCDSSVKKSLQENVIDVASSIKYPRAIDILPQNRNDQDRAQGRDVGNSSSISFSEEFKNAMKLVQNATLKDDLLSGHKQVLFSKDLKHSESDQRELSTALGTQLGVNTKQDDGINNAEMFKSQRSMKSTLNQQRLFSGPVTRGALQSDRNNHTSVARRNFLSTTANHPVKLNLTSQCDQEAIVQSLVSEASSEKNQLQARTEAAAVCEKVDPNDFCEKAEDYDVMGNRSTNEQPVHLSNNKASLKIALVGICGDMEVGDLDELDENNSGVLVSPDHSYVWLPVPQGTPIQFETAIELKTLLLGSCKKDFPLEWKIQSFYLGTNPKINYGIIQKKGGPCGVLACVQAYLIKELMFVKAWKGSSKGGITEEECKKCLASALAHMLWKIGLAQKAVIVMPANRTIVGLSGLHDGFIERINLMQFTDFAALQSFLTKHVTWFAEENNYSCISFLYSAILSRGIDAVKKDMDDPKSCLIGTHGYCSQEVVNLLLTGCASSNVFDNVITLDDGKESRSILKGITRQSDIGLLALFEHYNSCQVGAFLKCPRYPIWVVCSESHFSVLFAKDPAVCESSLKNENKINKFDLYYYDGLLHQEDEIRLTISLSNNSPPTCPDDLIPPLDLCIKTKWKDAHVEWNGIEPLL